MPRAVLAEVASIPFGNVFAALMQAGATARAIVDREAVHPSFAEGVQAVVMALPRYVLS
jgi:hypothetical protein